MAGYIGQVHIDQADYKIGSTLFAVLDTDSTGTINTNNGTTTFSVPLEGFVLTDGVTIHIQFKQTWTNPSDSTTFMLKIGNTAAKEIKNPNGAVIWQANSVIAFTYDTNYYIMNTVGFDVSGITIDASQLSNLTLGNIQSNGALQTNDVTIAANDKLVITDSSDNNKIARASLAFTAPITTQNQSTTFLRSDGTWAVPSYTTDTNTRRSIKVNDTEILSSSSTTALNLVSGSNISIINDGGDVTIASTYSYTLSLAADGTRGGIQIGYSSTGKKYAVQLENEKAYVEVPWTDTKVIQTAKTDNVAYKLLFSAAGTNPSSGSAYQAVYYTGLTFNPSSKTLSIIDGSTTGTLTATNYSGKAATAGVADSANSVTLEHVTGADDLKAIEGLTETSGLLKKTAANTWTLDTTEYATQSSVNGLLAAADAMTFKGTIGTGGTIQTLPSTHSAGDTYRVITANTYAGQACEEGDLIICIKDASTASNASDSDWTVVQTNVDGTVTGPVSSTGGHIATFNGTSGKIIQDSGYTIATSVPANAIFTDKKVEQKKYTTSTDSEFRLLFKKTANNTDETDFVYYSDINDKNITYNPSTGTLTAAKFSGDGSGLSNVAAASVEWNAVDNKVLSNLYINTTAAGATEDVATANTTTYIHLYDNNIKQDTIQLKGSGNVTISSTNAKVVTISATQFVGATASANGTAGYLAAPGKGNQDKFLEGSGSWKALSIPTIASVANGTLTITNVALSVT